MLQSDADFYAKEVKKCPKTGKNGAKTHHSLYYIMRKRPCQWKECKHMINSQCFTWNIKNCTVHEYTSFTSRARNVSRETIREPRAKCSMWNVFAPPCCFFVPRETIYTKKPPQVRVGRLFALLYAFSCVFSALSGAFSAWTNTFSPILAHTVT